MIEVKNLTKKYKKKKVLDKVSFTVKGGEFVSLIGPSGAGKTTLINCLIAKDRIDQGSIKLDSLNLGTLNPSQVQDYRKKIGIVFQDYKLLPQKTVFENVAFALEVCGYPKQFIHKRTVEVLKITGMEELRNSFPYQLSGGERQRTAIARALVHAPDLLFADEPTGNLDPENSIILGTLLKKINDHGTTVILSTHNPYVVDMIKERVITLKAGKVVSDRKKAGYQ